jgi:hypothetical protein
MVYGMVKKGGKTKKKKDKGGDRPQPEVPQEPNATDSDDEDGDVDTEATVTMSAASSISFTPAGPSGPRKGKTTKRIEKEKQIEREQRAAQLKDRLTLEQARSREIEAAKVAPSEGTQDGASQPAATPAAPASAAGVGGQKCNTCGGSFPDAAAYRSHFKSEWHR